MKKFLDTVDASARLLDYDSRGGSSGALSDQGALYQSYPASPASAPVTAFNGSCGHNATDRDAGKDKKVKGTKKVKDELPTAKVHRVRTSSCDGLARILCTIGCCGKGRMEVTWTVEMSCYTSV